MMNRIVLVVGGVETLEYFSKRLADRFETLGYRIFLFDLKDAKNSAKKMRKFLKPRETALVTFNFEGLEKEQGVYQEGIGYIWDTYQIACYNIAADHPYFYHEQFCDLPTNYYHISIDRFHEAYMKQFYPTYRTRGFLPLAGTALYQEEEKFPKIKERGIEVLFTGNYTELSFFEPYIHWINDEYAAFYRGIIDELLVETDKTVEEVALAHCFREMGENQTEDLRIALSKMIFIDLYVRNYWRGMVVRTLVDAGIKVNVVGKGWDKLDCAHPENLVIHPQTDSVSCLRMLLDAKISLNVMPWFKDGAHDRVFNSIANGALCITDTSKYLCETLKEGEGVCYFSLNSVTKLPEIVKDLLQDENKMQDIVVCGRRKVLNIDLWANRADTLAAWIQEDAKQNS